MSTQFLALVPLPLGDGPTLAYTHLVKLPFLEAPEEQQMLTFVQSFIASKAFYSHILTQSSPHSTDEEIKIIGLACPRTQSSK